jgi:acyl-CoA hydrolase
VTVDPGDLHYVVTEYGIAYLHGKNVRDRAMALISIAHPKFRSQLIKEAKERNLITGTRRSFPASAASIRTNWKNTAIRARASRCSCGR